ncbi:MAG: hypothetical protein G3M78_15310 [Candidatus Nitrohelix vancouverensis]|uniref:Uncharacterized protein n=1 Tax=Candidatus Nitrohelix vancouverensis TaxID=2705534 RepID=A0A7T0G4N8_9BACT|nr:MAG: hypothetical protein G3M78_15310 [Candidatus Nitrohelix vancouverensis]
MKSLATIGEKDIETIQMALNDAISDMNTELKGDLSDKQRESALDFKNKYTRVFESLKKNPSIYALTEGDLDIVAGGLNDAVQLIDENLSDDLTEQEHSEIMTYKDDCVRIIDILAGD